MEVSRRALLGGLAAAQALQAQRPAQSKPWRPKLGIYCKYSPANLEFAQKEGFTCLQLATGGLLTPETGDEQLEQVKATIKKSGLMVAALGATANHIDPNPAARAQVNAHFIKTLELAGKMGVPSVGSISGAMPGESLDKQVAEIVRVYEEKYFPVCEKHKVRILWEPWASPANIALGPVPFAALFKAFHDSPHVGLQLDPSHLAWQMIDPAACVREFGSKIFNVHLKDTEILWPVLRRVGIRPVDDSRWWRFRVPGSGSIDWKAFFSALADTGYNGAMNIENEDQFYYPNYEGNDFTESFKSGYRAAHAFLRQYLPLMA